MTFLKVFVSCLFMLLSFCADAQRDTTEHMPVRTLNGVEVVSQASRKVVDLLKKETIWDANRIQTSVGINVSDLLQQSSSVYVKSYGSGGLATVSIRGAGAGRSATVWNDMPLLGSTLGLLDYSLLNTGMFETVNLSVGGDSGKHGSGSIGGNVQLDNRNEIYGEDGYTIGLRSVLGSFGRFHQGVKYGFKKNKWWATTRLSFEEAKQNFTYQIREDLPVKENTNAARSQFSILQTVGCKLDSNNEVELHIWAQDNLRQIPPTTVQTRSEAEIEDQFARVQAIWKYKQHEKLSWKTIVAATHNVNDYVDPLAGVFGNNVFDQYYVKTAASYKKGNRTWNAGLSNRHTKAQTENYRGLQTQNTLSLFADYGLTLNKWRLYISVREELLDDKLNPLSGKVAATYYVSNKLNFKATANRHYRNPALNDLYWAPGGDASLESENGWSQELAMEYTYRNNMKWSIHAFNSKVNNWIQWGLLEERDFYSALNLPQVWSRGFEAHLAIQKGSSARNVSLNMSYTHNLSTYEFSLKNPALLKGDRVFYAPVHQAVGTIKFRLPRYVFSYSHRVQSEVDTFLDPLKGFNIGDLKLQTLYKDVNLFFTVQNIWDSSYRVIVRRPMPGRNYNIGINFKINNLFKN